ncbi:MAG: CsbD family protein [Deltaproteobacteria bacterium]|nr:CsbD family protein [Deltaproteobacteria bacterium]
MGKNIDKAKGKIKQAVGALTGNAALKKEGERDERKGKVEGAVDGVKKAAKDASKAVGDAVK